MRTRLPSLFIGDGGYSLPEAASRLDRKGGYLRPGYLRLTTVDDIPMVVMKSIAAFSFGITILVQRFTISSAVLAAVAEDSQARA